VAHDRDLLQFLVKTTVNLCVLDTSSNKQLLKKQLLHGVALLDVCLVLCVVITANLDPRDGTARKPALPV
jgi:hypothetical protein